LDAVRIHKVDAGSGSNKITGGRPVNAKVAELADAPDLGSRPAPMAHCIGFGSGC